MDVPAEGKNNGAENIQLLFRQPEILGLTKTNQWALLKREAFVFYCPREPDRSWWKRLLLQIDRNNSEPYLIFGDCLIPMKFQTVQNPIVHFNNSGNCGYENANFGGAALCGNEKEGFYSGKTQKTACSVLLWIRHTNLQSEFPTRLQSLFFLQPSQIAAFLCSTSHRYVLC